jgi:tetratricopeptide (TPR) repeat protein
MLADRFGNAVSCSSADALTYYIDALDSLFCMRPDALALADKALQIDSAFALAHCVRARALVLEGRNSDAHLAIKRATELVDQTPVCEQEAAHVQIVAMVTRGETAAALPLVEKHALEYPRDALPLSFAVGVYGLYGFGGYNDHHARQLQFLQSVEHEWNEDWWFLASLGWSHVEVGNVDVGVPMLDRSLQLRNDNASAAHGRAHGYYEAGQAREGGSFIADWLPGYDRSGPLHCHLAWHQALFALQQGEVEHARKIFTESVRPEVSLAMPMFTIIDTAAMLWRFRLAGLSVDEQEISALVDFMEETFPGTSIPFVNVHAMFAYSLAGDMPAMSRRLQDIADLVLAGKQNSGDVVLHIAQAICELSQGAPAKASILLDDARSAWAALGGSNAQRDVFFETLLATLTLKGNPEAAHALARERAQKRSSHLDDAWFAGLHPQEGF